MACVIQQKDARQWFAELAVDLEKVFICLLLSLAVFTLVCHGCELYISTEVYKHNLVVLTRLLLVYAVCDDDVDRF